MAEPPTTIERRRISFAEYWALPEELRAEYVDGEALVNPPPSFQHQMICQRLLALLETAVGGRAPVVGGAGWHLPGPAQRIRIPDVMVLAEPPVGPVITAAPLLVVEVLSTNRAEDLDRKSAEYLNAGVGQYWILDPRDRVIEVFGNAGDRWQTLARLTRDTPVGSIDVAGYGAVPVSLTQVLDG